MGAGPVAEGTASNPWLSLTACGRRPWPVGGPSHRGPWLFSEVASGTMGLGTRLVALPLAAERGVCPLPHGPMGIRAARTEGAQGLWHLDRSSSSEARRTQP